MSWPLRSLLLAVMIVLMLLTPGEDIEFIYFSSDRLIPNGAWLKTWMVAAAMTCVAIIVLACLFIRHRDEQSNPLDQYEPWAAKRQLASQAGANGVIFIGCSRIHSAIRISEVRTIWPGCTPVQLALNGCACWDVLDDLARDPSIRGLVVVDYTPHVEFRGGLDPRALPRRWTARVHGLAQPKRLRDLPFSYRYLFFIGDPRYSWTRVFTHITHEDVDMVTSNGDRDLLYDYSHSDPAAVAVGSLEPYGLCTADTAVLASHVRRMAEDVRMMRSRGGEVVVVEFPIGMQLRARGGSALPEIHVPFANSGDGRAVYRLPQKPNPPCRSSIPLTVSTSTIVSRLPLTRQCCKFCTSGFARAVTTISPDRIKSWR